MSRKRCIRRHWNPVNPIAHVIEGMAATPEEKLNQLRLRELSAIESFRTGTAEPGDWRVIADICNLTETLISMGVGAEAMSSCQAAQTALGEAHRRLQEHGRLALAGPELQSIRDVYEYHELQRQSVSRAEYERAIQRTMARIRSAHPSVKVYLS